MRMMSGITSEAEHWSYQPLLEKLEQAGMEYLDMGLGLLEYLGDRSHCESGQSARRLLRSPTCKPCSIRHRDLVRVCRYLAGYR